MKNKYCGSKTLSFKIVPKATKITKSHQKEEGTEYFLEKQKKQVSGYQIQVSTSRKFKSKKTKNISWYEKEQYYGIQVKIQKEILYPDQNLEKRKTERNTILPGQKLKIGKTK